MYRTRVYTKKNNNIYNIYAGSRFSCAIYTVQNAKLPPFSEQKKKSSTRACVGYTQVCEHIQKGYYRNINALLLYIYIYTIPPFFCRPVKYNSLLLYTYYTTPYMRILFFRRFFQEARVFFIISGQYSYMCMLYTQKITRHNVGGIRRLSHATIVEQ